MKKNIVGTVPKSNGKIVETEAKSTPPNTDTYNTHFPGLVQVLE